MSSGELTVINAELIAALWKYARTGCEGSFGSATHRLSPIARGRSYAGIVVMQELRVHHI